MAQLSDKNTYQAQPSGSPDWPELVSKTVKDLSDIARTEVELLEATLTRLIEAQTAKIFGMVILLFGAGYGSLFLLGGIVLLLHRWLAWWLSFLITGVAIVIVAFLVESAMSAKSRQIKS